MGKIYKVGGAVRDAFLEKQSKDIDYAVEAASFDEMREEIKRRDYKIYLETPKYLTIRAHGADGPADFALCRKDGTYKDGRHPDSVEVGSIQEDLARRDLTINAIAVDLDSGEILDPFKGQEDIKAKIIRCVGKAKDRFDEDRLRILRALRFSVVLGFTFDLEVLKALYSARVEDFAATSTDRIRDELYKMFAFDTVASVRQLYEFDDILKLTRERKIWLKPTTEEV